MSMLIRTIARCAVVLLGLSALASASGCRVVAPHQREHLADPTMAAQPDPLQSNARRKLHTAREGAGGGEGKPAGGGCGCSN